MDQSLKDKVVIITGASSGIGRELAIEYAKHGATVVCAARRIDRLNEVVERCATFAGKALAIKCDVSNSSDVDHMTSVVLKDYGRIDIVVGNAGFSITGNIAEVDVEDYARQFETNVLGIVRLIKASLSSLRKTSGRIVLLGSISGEIALPGSTPYSVSKHSVHALAEGLSSELAPEGISVTLVIPGYVDTEIRKLDNGGNFDPSIKDPISPWLLTSPQLVARKVVKGAQKRRYRVVVGIETKIALFLNHYFSFVIRMLRKMNIV